MRGFLKTMIVALPLVPALALADNTKFADGLYREARRSDGNIVFSPLSVRQAYTLLYPGAQGATALQLREIFGLADSNEAIAKDYKRLNAGTVKKGAFELGIANRVWINKSLPIESGYPKTLKRFYDAEIADLDVAAGEKPVNDWVEKQTRDRIKNLLPPGSVTPRTSLILTNAVYLNAKWVTPFKAEATRPGAFKIESGKPVTTPLMRGRPTGRIFKGNDLVAVALPYRDTDLHFIAVMPLESKLAVLEKNFEARSIVKELFNGPETKIDLTLPRFEITQTLKLNPALESLGLKSPLNLGNITKDSAEVTGIQKAFLRVDEDGTEAAAATAATMVGTAFQEVPIVRLDRPFLFLIADPKTLDVFFQGRLVKP